MISISFHVQTFVTRSTDLLLQFPEWYSAVVLPLMIALILFVRQLRLRPACDRSLAGATATRSASALTPIPVPSDCCGGSRPCQSMAGAAWLD